MVPDSVISIDDSVANPPVLILDEATSSIRKADAIMVLEHGRILERSEHEALLAHRGTYYQLYTGALEQA